MNAPKLYSFLVNTSSSHFLGNKASVFQSELYAIEQACRLLSNNRIFRQKVNIHIDSRSSIESLDAKFINSDQVMRTVLALNMASDLNKIHLRWVKAHVGHVGNERADELAKVGAADTDAVVADPPKTPYYVIKNEIKEKVVSYWDKEWQIVKKKNNCRQTKHFFPELDRKLSVEYMKNRRTLFSAVIQFVTGHNFMLRHQALVKQGKSYYRKKNAKCTYCEKGEESTYHMLSECEKHAMTRFMIWGQPELKPPYKITFREIHEFLTQTKMKNFQDILNFKLADEQNDAENE